MDTIENYNEESIRSLDWKEHIRLRPGMYIGKLGDGSSHDDGIYVLIKEVIDNCIDEFTMGHGRNVEVTIKEHLVTIRDYGRGIPPGVVALRLPGRPRRSKGSGSLFLDRRSLGHPVKTRLSLTRTRRCASS